MCGIAGHMLMELGFHSRDVPERVLESDPERDEIVAITCSIIILDRQWSVATGLPTHFELLHFSHFHHSQKSSVKTPRRAQILSETLVADPSFTYCRSSILT
jgi:hypothetical protein